MVNNLNMISREYHRLITKISRTWIIINKNLTMIGTIKI